MLYKKGDIIIAWRSLTVKILDISNTADRWTYYVLVLRSNACDRMFRPGFKYYLQDLYGAYKPNQKLAKLIYD